MLLKEKVDLEALEKLKYSRKLLEDSSVDNNHIQMLDIYSKHIKNGTASVKYVLEKYGRLKNIIGKDIGYSYTNMKKDIRNILAHKYYNYVDIKNCQPTIIYNLSKSYNITNNALLDYINNRDVYYNKYVVENGISIKEIKGLFISLFYGKKSLYDIKTIIFKGKKVDDWIIKLFEEIKNIRKLVLEKDVYHEMIVYSNKKRKDKNRNYNLDGAAFSLIIQDLERQIITEYENLIKGDGYVIGARIHDGIFIDKIKNLEDEIITSWNRKLSLALGLDREGYLPYILRKEEMTVDSSYLETMEFDYYDKPEFEFNTISSRFLDYDEITKYFEGVKYRVLKSGYGTGKTTYIGKILDKLDDTEEYQRVLFLTMRQSLARSIYKEFCRHNFKNYLNKKELVCNDDDRVIISLDSLHKIGNNKVIIPYDIVICDEFCSLLSHMSFDGIKNQHYTYNIFDEIIKKSQATYFLDGDISNREVLFLKKYFGYVDKPLVNTCVNIKYEFIIVNDYESYMREIDDDIRSNLNVAIASMSSNFTENIGELYKNRNPLIINSNTDDEIKEQLFDVNELFGKHSLIAFSPTVGSGVDCNIQHFDKLYGYMCNGSVCSRDFMQMLFRIRNIVNKKVVIYVKNINKSTLPKIKTFNEIKTALYKDYEIPPLTYIELWNKWERDNNDMYLLDIFMYYAKLKGHTVTIRNKEVVIPEIEEEDDDNTTAKKNNIILEGIYNIELVDKECYDALTEKVKLNNATKQDKYKIDKYIHYSRWLLDNTISLSDFKKYYHKLNVLKSYRIYENIETFEKILKILDISNNDDDIYNKFTRRLISEDAVTKLYSGDQTKINKEKTKVKKNLANINKVLNVMPYEIYDSLRYLFWKMGYDIAYMKTDENQVSRNKHKFILEIYNTIFKKEFTKKSIYDKLRYVARMKNILELDQLGDSKRKEELETKMPQINELVKDNVFKTLFGIRNNGIKSIKALLGIVNIVFNDFGLEIKSFQFGNGKHRTYEYKLLRMDIIEEYLKRVEVKGAVELDM